MFSVNTTFGVGFKVPANEELTIAQSPHFNFAKQQRRLEYVTYYIITIFLDQNNFFLVKKQYCKL